MGCARRVNGYATSAAAALVWAMVAMGLWSSDLDAHSGTTAFIE